MGSRKCERGSPNLALVILGVHATFALFELGGRSVWEAKTAREVTKSGSGDMAATTILARFFVFSTETKILMCLKISRIPQTNGWSPYRLLTGSDHVNAHFQS